LKVEPDSASHDDVLGIVSGLPTNRESMVVTAFMRTQLTPVACQKPIATYYGRSSFTTCAVSPLFRQVDLASASESLCRGLGSRWFSERFHRNALVTHFQHGQVFCTARQLKDYGVSRCR